MKLTEPAVPFSGRRAPSRVWRWPLDPGCGGFNETPSLAISGDAEQMAGELFLFDVQP